MKNFITELEILRDIHKEKAESYGRCKAFAQAATEQERQLTIENILLMLKKREEEQPVTYTADEVKGIVQNIYAEFAESHRSLHTTKHLRTIIEQEVEQRPIKPIQIFTKK